MRGGAEAAGVGKRVEAKRNGGAEEEGPQYWEVYATPLLLAVPPDILTLSSVLQGCGATGSSSGQRIETKSWGLGGGKGRGEPRTWNLGAGACLPQRGSKEILTKYLDPVITANI